MTLYAVYTQYTHLVLKGQGVAPYVKLFFLFDEWHFFLAQKKKSYSFHQKSTKKTKKYFYQNTIKKVLFGVCKRVIHGRKTKTMMNRLSENLWYYTGDCNFAHLYIFFLICVVSFIVSLRFGQNQQHTDPTA